jgi:energy-coupling factor transport system permease protein
VLNDITIGQYLPGNSAVHRADPRVKILLLIAFIVFVFIADTVTGYVALAGYVILVAAIAKVPFKMMLKSIRPLRFILVFTMILNVFLLKDGDTLWQWGILEITAGGIIYALRLAARLIILVMGTSLLTYTTTPIALTDGMERLLSPLKIIKFPAHELAMMMSIALRMIPTLLEETDKIMKAQKARGASFDTGGLIQRAKAMVPLLVPLFINAFRRADDLSMAMESRCYHGGEGRTRMKVLHMGRIDVAAITINAALLGIILLGRYLF